MRHQVAAIVGAVIWVFAIENLAAGFLGDAGKLLPNQAAVTEVGPMERLTIRLYSLLSGW